jgi:hypothetical protein
MAAASGRVGPGRSILPRLLHLLDNPQGNPVKHVLVVQKKVLAERLQWNIRGGGPEILLFGQDSPRP